MKGTSTLGLNRESDASTTILPFHSQAHTGYKFVQLDLNLLWHMGTKIAGMITLYFSHLKVQGSFLCQNYCIDFCFLFSLCCVWIFEFFVNIWIYAMVKCVIQKHEKKKIYFLSFSLDWLTYLVRVIFYFWIWIWSVWFGSSFS